MTVELDRWIVSFVGRLKPALRTSIAGLVAGADPGDIVGLGAYTDADARSIVTAVNTAAHLRAQGDARPELREYYRWSIGEWDRTAVDLIEQGGQDALAAVTEEAGRVADRVRAGEAGDDDLQVVRHLVWEAVVNALGQLFDDGFFDAFPVAVQVFDVPENDVGADTLLAWMSALNTDVAAAGFARRISAR